MKKQLALFIFVAAALAAAPSAARADFGTSWFGADFQLMPSGSNTASGMLGNGGSASSTSDTQTAYAIGITAEEQGNGIVSFGLAPRYMFNVLRKDQSGDTYGQLDLRARVAVGPSLMGHKMRVYGFAEPGWSIIFPPSSSAFHVSNDTTVHPNGFVVGVGGGAAYAVTPKLRAVFELGYEWGFQSWSYTATVLGVSATASGDYKNNFLSLGFGAEFAID